MVMDPHTYLKPGRSVFMHIGNIGQQVQIIESLTKDELRVGDKGVLICRFESHPEILRENAAILVRERQVTGFGIVTNVYS